MQEALYCGFRIDGHVPEAGRAEADSGSRKRLSGGGGEPLRYRLAHQPLLCASSGFLNRTRPKEDISSTFARQRRKLMPLLALQGCVDMGRQASSDVQAG
jgi:hypothetical protein